MKNNTLLKLLTFTLLCALCTACGPSNTVSLMYPPKDSSILPAPGAPNVAVVLFADKRAYMHLGLRTDGSTFAGSIAANEWISRSFADALSRHGLQVSFAESTEQARRAAPAYIVTGIVHRAEITDSSATELRTNMQVEITLAGPQGRIMNEGLSASQSEVGLITTSAAEKLLLQTVQDLVQPGAAKVAGKILK